jgi:hypothetical protein
MLVKGAVRTPSGLRNVTALLDRGADSSFLSQRLAKEHHLPLEHLDGTGVACDGHEVTLYGHAIVPYRPKDSRGTRREMFQSFYTADIAHDVLLGRDWLAQVEPDTRWAEAKWYFRDKPVSSIEEVSAEQFEKEVLVRPSRIVSVLYLGTVVDKRRLRGAR